MDFKPRNEQARQITCKVNGLVHPSHPMHETLSLLHLPAALHFTSARGSRQNATRSRQPMTPRPSARTQADRQLCPQGGKVRLVIGGDLETSGGGKVETAFHAKYRGNLRPRFMETHQKNKLFLGLKLVPWASCGPNNARRSYKSRGRLPRGMTSLTTGLGSKF